MSSARTSDRLARTAGIVAGLATVAIVLALNGRPASRPIMGASVKVYTGPTGELAVSPAGRPVLSATGLKPGGKGRGSNAPIRIANQTATDLGISLRARSGAGQRDLDGLLRLRFAVAGRRVADLRLGELRGWSPRLLRLPAGARRRLTLSVTLPANAPRGWEGLTQDVTLELRATRMAA